jgi:hypothetical protein
MLVADLRVVPENVSTKILNNLKSVKSKLKELFIQIKIKTNLMHTHGE